MIKVSEIGMFMFVDYRCLKCGKEIHTSIKLYGAVEPPYDD